MKGVASSFSTKNTIVKSKNISKIPSGRVCFGKEKCMKNDISHNKSKQKLTTRRLKKNSSHSKGYKGSHTRNHFKSLENQHTINKYLSRAINPITSKEKHKSYETENKIYSTINPNYETVNTYFELSEQERLELGKEEEANLISEQIKNKREQKDIEDKLERDYQNYLQRKQDSSESQDPERSKFWNYFK